MHSKFQVPIHYDTQKQGMSTKVMTERPAFMTTEQVWGGLMLLKRKTYFRYQQL